MNITYIQGGWYEWYELWKEFQFCLREKSKTNSEKVVIQNRPMQEFVTVI